jgi:NAD(P)-dependent dehydrogenase (short-subunit alcohol dehydrogenase family)
MKRTLKSIRMTLSSAEGGKPCTVYVQADVQYALQVENLVKRTVSEFGRLDIMVNNAGVGVGPHTIINVTEEKYDFLMAINIKGVWLCCKYAIAQMLKQEPLETGSRGKIVNIASVAAIIGRVGNTRLRHLKSCGGTSDSPVSSYVWPPSEST